MVLWIVQVSCQVQSYWDGQDKSPENVRHSSSSYWVGVRYTSVSIITSCYSNGSIKAHHYRAMLCIRGTIHGPVCVSVSLSVTRRCSTKTAKHRITQTAPHDTPGSLVF